MKTKILINNSKQEEVLTEHLKHLLHICYIETITNKTILVHPCRITISGLKPKKQIQVHGIPKVPN
jgi:hypothetical protein